MSDDEKPENVIAKAIAQAIGVTLIVAVLILGVAGIVLAWKVLMWAVQL